MIINLILVLKQSDGKRHFPFQYILSCHHYVLNILRYLFTTQPGTIFTQMLNKEYGKTYPDVTSGKKVTVLLWSWLKEVSGGLLKTADLLGELEPGLAPAYGVLQASATRFPSVHTGQGLLQWSTLQSIFRVLLPRSSIQQGARSSVPNRSCG